EHARHGTGAGGRGGQAPGAAHRRPGQARRPLRRQLPARGLRPVEPGERGLPPDRRAHAVQEPLPGPPHLHDVAALAAPGQLRHARARADAARPALVRRLGGRHLPELQPALRRAPGLRLRLRRRPHLPDGPPADGRPAHRGRGGRDGRRPAGPARPGRPVRRHRRGAGRPPDRRLPREAGGRRRPARRPGPDLRLHGQLRLHHGRAHRGRARGRRGRVLQARRGRQPDPDARRARAGAGLRLQQERGPGRLGPRPGLLARRGDDRRLLRRPHGPHLGPPDLQPLQLPLAHPHLARAAAAREVRLRRGAAHGARAGLHGLLGRRHLGRDGGALRALPRGAHPLLLLRAGLRAHARRGGRPQRRRPPGDPRQERAGGARRPHRRGPRRGPRALPRLRGRRRGGAEELHGHRV
ncbi:MAG: Glucose-1-phosphate adenylyltransferase, partial [uncultured Solirubrobacteraceae bacterium]